MAKKLPVLADFQHNTALKKGSPKGFELKRFDPVGKHFSSGEKLADKAATGTPWTPWTIVPADSKAHRNLMIATAMKQVFQDMKLRYPPGDPALNLIRVV